MKGPGEEQPLTFVPGPGWAGCARRLAADPRLEMFAVGPDPNGWSVIAGAAGEPVEWTEGSVGELVYVGHILAAGGRIRGRDAPVRGATRRCPLHHHPANWNA